MSYNDAGYNSDSSIEDIAPNNHGEESAADSYEVQDAEPPRDDRFKRLDIWDQWTEVIQDLDNGTATWDDLQDYKKQALIARDSRQPKTPTFLHNMTKIKHFTKISDILQRQIISYILQNRNSYISVENRGVREDPILKVAMEYCTNEFFRKLVECVEEENLLPEFISAVASDGMNCIHYGFKDQMRAARRIDKSKGRWSPGETFNVLKLFVIKAPPEALIAVDELGNTPLHYAVDYSLCHWNQPNYPKLIKLLVKKSEDLFLVRPGNQINRAGESPYRYFVATKSSFDRSKTAGAVEDTDKHFIKMRTNYKDKEIEEAKERKDRSLGNYEVDVTERPETFAPKTKDLPRKPGMTGSEFPRYSRGRQFSVCNDESTNHIQGGQYSGETSGSMLPPPNRNTSVGRPKTSEVREDSRVRPMLSRRGTQIYSSVATQSEGRPDRDMATHTEEPTKVSQADLDAKKYAKDIGEYLKDHYIRKRCDVEAKELLYGKASDRNLYFDCTHLRGKSVSEVIKLIEALAEAGGFEDTLSYVSLPLLTGCHDKEKAQKSTNKVPSANERRSRNVFYRETQQPDCKMIIKVFDALVNANVRRIVRLQVEDRVSCPHEDAAIERAILGRDRFSLLPPREPAHSIAVERWDWRKPDLGIDVILFASPKVEHITLYWSGSPVVLSAWGSTADITRDDGKRDDGKREDGKSRSGKLGDSKREDSKPSSLKSITLQAFTGNESPARVEKLLEQFEERFNPKDGQESEDMTRRKRFLSSEINRRTILLSPDPDGDGDVADGAADRSNDHKWIDRMDGFRGALMSIHRQLGVSSYPQTKVVLIDDGVDLSNLETYGFLQPLRGMSYPPRNGETELPWYQSANGHGTTMAKMIVRINPFVLLYVIRIHETTSYASGVVKRSIFARSAGNAIEAAIQKKPDIISMSWTIKKFVKDVKQQSDPLQPEKKSADEIDIDFLSNAIKNAESKGILMFCSASDDIEHRAKDFLPYSAADKSIIRIGSATSSGQRDALSEDKQRIDYFFPGINVSESRNPKSTAPIQYHDGSSVATALAAGLASVILHCTRVLASRSDIDQKLFTEWAGKLPSPDHMRTAFNSIHEGKTDEDDSKFLPVWMQFKEEYTKSIKEGSALDEKLDILKTIIKSICRKVGVRD